jgi:hypothetical protein
LRKVTFRRCSVTFDLNTIKKCRELAAQKGQSVSALLRLLVSDAAEEEAAKKARTGVQALLKGADR